MNSEQSLVDVRLADSSVEERAPRKVRKQYFLFFFFFSFFLPFCLFQARPKAVFKLKTPPRGDEEVAETTSDNESPREHKVGAHRRVAAVPVSVPVSSEPESSTVSALVSPRGKFVGFMRDKQNAMKQTIVKTLGRKNAKDKEKDLAPLEDWDEGAPDATDQQNLDFAPPPPSAPDGTAAARSDVIVPSVLALPMQRNERPVYCFSGLLWAYDFYNPDAMRVGTCYITNADVGFLPDEETVEGFRVPLQMVASVGKVGKKSGKGELYFLNFQLHDFRAFRLAVPKTSDQRGSLFDVLMQAVFVDAPQQFFAFSRERMVDGMGWNVYVAESEWLRQFERLRLLQLEVKRKTVCVSRCFFFFFFFFRSIGEFVSILIT